LVETTLPILQSNIDDTMSMVTDTTLIIIGVVIGLLCLLIALMSVYIASPLGKIMVISQQIIAAIGTEESKRDYTTAMTDAFFLQNARGDEIGALTSEFFVVVTMLHNKNVEKILIQSGKKFFEWWHASIVGRDTRTIRVGTVHRQHVGKGLMTV
jgi:hypothetical protein